MEDEDYFLFVLILKLKDFKEELVDSSFLKLVIGGFLRGIFILKLFKGKRKSSEDVKFVSIGSAF